MKRTSEQCGSGGTRSGTPEVLSGLRGGPSAAHPAGRRTVTEGARSRRAVTRLPSRRTSNGSDRGLSNPLRSSGLFGRAAHRRTAKHTRARLPILGAVQRLIDTHPIRTYLVIVAIFAAAPTLIGGKWTWFLLFGVLAPGYIVSSAQSSTPTRRRGDRGWRRRGRGSRRRLGVVDPPVDFAHADSGDRRGSGDRAGDCNRVRPTGTR